MTARASMQRGLLLLWLFSLFTIISFKKHLVALLPAQPRTINANAITGSRNYTRHRNIHGNISSDSPRYVICTRVKDEAPYLGEWIEYHLLIGFDSFFILNDRSEDDTQCILDRYADEDVVKRIPFDVIEHNSKSERVGQGDVFRICVDYLKSHPDQYNQSQTWMMTHDVDEFVFFQPGESKITSMHDAVTKLLQSNYHARSLEVPRLIFGSSGNDYGGADLVMERFTQRFDLESCLESNQKNNVQECKRDSLKSISLVSSMAQDCCGERCHATHRHTILDPLSQNNSTERDCTKRHDRNSMRDRKYMHFKKVGKVAVIMHYQVKSRQEFYSRACGSGFARKYFRCTNCNPGSYFNNIDTYANNHKDERMMEFASRVKHRLNHSSAAATCNTKADLHSLDHYRNCFDRVKSEFEKKDKGKAQKEKTRNTNALASGTKKAKSRKR